MTLSLTEANGSATLSVENTGIGVPANDLPQIFSRFHRGRNTASYPGSGLGLAMVKAIVEGHQGQVRAEPRTLGTRFTISLPISRAQ